MAKRKLYFCELVRNYLVNCISGYRLICGEGSYVYLGLGLSSSTIDASTGTITGFTEPSADSYNRVCIYNPGYVQTVSEADDGKADNTIQIAFDQILEADGWGTIKYWGLFKNETGGNPVIVGELYNSGSSEVATSQNKVVILKRKTDTTDGDLHTEFPYEIEMADPDEPEQ